MPIYYKGEEPSLTGKVYITMTRSTTEGRSRRDQRDPVRSTPDDGRLRDWV